MYPYDSSFFWRLSFEGEMRARLETAANVAILGLCLLVGARALFPSDAHPVPSRGDVVPEYQPGESLEIQGVDFSKSPRTLILAMRSTCIHCTKSLPFYRLLREEQKRSRSIRLVAVGLEDIDETSAYLFRNGVQVDDIVATRTSMKDLKIRGTPTLILANADGKVERVWSGRLRPQQETEVLSLMRPDR